MFINDCFVCDKILYGYYLFSVFVKGKYIFFELVRSEFYRDVIYKCGFLSILVV